MSALEWFVIEVVFVLITFCCLQSVVLLLSEQMDAQIGSEPERTRPFYPNDNAVPLASVDWKTRFNELKNQCDWDPVRDFVGLKRLGDSYHPLDPFFKFEGIPKGNEKFDRLWWPLLFGIGGLALGATANWYSRRPFWSSIIPTVLTGAAASGLAVGSGYMSRKRGRERDAVLIHYMILHEHDLPRIERKRFGQITRPWIPFRMGSDGVFVDKPEPKN